MDPIAAAHIYDHRPLTERIVRTINPEASLADVATDILDAKYPHNPAYRSLKAVRNRPPGAVEQDNASTRRAVPSGGAPGPKRSGDESVDRQPTPPGLP